MYKTDWISENEIERKWYIVDADNQILGRVATQIARLIIGKDKVKQVPNMDCGDHVVVINCRGVKLSSNKGAQKIYYTHSGYIGSLKEESFDKLLVRQPTRVMSLAVQRMLPDTKLRKSMMKRLHLYAGSEHKHEAQKPKEYKLISSR